MRSYGSWPAYVSIDERRAKAERLIAKRKKKGETLNPVCIQGRNIVQTFWGKAWCKNLESYSDFESRLPKGRSYVRNGAVIDLKITGGKIIALVVGSAEYKVEISITSMEHKQWDNLAQLCSGKIDSLIELLQGKFSKAVMELMTDSAQGLFPKPKEIKLNCSCMDWASMCKHVAAVMYGVGAYLDNQPEGLFLLRQVDHMDLLASASTSSVFNEAVTTGIHIADEELSSVFGIEMDGPDEQPDVPPKTQGVKRKKNGSSSKE